MSAESGEKPRKKPLKIIHVELHYEKDVKIYETFLEATEFFPQGKKDALLRAMKLYIEDVKRQQAGWVSLGAKTLSQREAEKSEGG